MIKCICRILRCLLLSCTVIVLQASFMPALAQQAYANFIAFGDSLSDTGSLASATINFPYPYFENRISNGPLAVDYLSSEIGSNALASALGGSNFSVAGGNILGAEVEDLDAQVSAFLNRVGGVAEAQALYFLMIGGNDLRGLRAQTSSALAQLAMVDLVDALMAQMIRLQNAGAKVFFVANIPNIGRIPETLEREVTDPGVSDRVMAYTKFFNRLLADRLQTFRQLTDSVVFEFDLYAEFEKILDAPATFGFSQSTVGCFDINSYRFHPDCVFGTRFDRFVFFDNLHPSGETNRLVGSAMIAGLNTLPIIPPLPDAPAPAPQTEFWLAGMLLLLLGD